jgi:ATP-dependent exoDNAse (exonuclease V) beta subunit
VGASLEEVEAAAAVAEVFTTSPIWKRMQAAREVHREMPLFLKVDGSTLEGVADLVLVEDERVLVVDFKTDTPSDEQRAQYERQLGFYAASLSASYGIPCDGLLLLV